MSSLPSAEIGIVSEFVNGMAFKPADWEQSGRPIIRIQNLNDPSKPFNYTRRVVPDKYIVEPGELLMSWSASLGVFVWAGPEAVLNQHIFRVRPDSSKVDRSYFKYALEQALRIMDRYLHGSTMKHVNRGEFLSTKVFLPPLDEQRRIAAILDQADTIRRQRQEAIRLSEEFLRSAFLEMFGDPVTNPKGWKQTQLGKVASFHAGNSLPDGEPFDEQPGGYLLLKVGDMNLPGNERELVHTREWAASGQGIVAPAGSIVFPKRGGAIGTNKKRILRRPAFLDPNVMAVEAGALISETYLYAWFLLFNLSDIASGSAVPQLNKRDLSPLPIVIPPPETLEEYRRVVDRVVVSQAQLNTATQEAENLFNSLVQRAFRAEL